MGLDAFFKAFPSAARGAQQGYADIENTMARVENIDQYYRNAEERRFLQQNMPALGNQTIAPPRAGLALPPNPADLASKPMPGQPLPKYEAPVAPTAPVAPAPTTTPRPVAPGGTSVETPTAGLRPPAEILNLPTEQLSVSEFQALPAAERARRVQAENQRRQAVIDRAALGKAPAAAADVLAGGPYNAIAQGGTWLANQIGVPRIGRALGIYDSDVTRVEIPTVGTGSGTPYFDMIRQVEAENQPVTEEQFIKNLTAAESKERTKNLASATKEGFADWQLNAKGKPIRGLVNNNPGNIRFDPKTEWVGGMGQKGGFVNFESPEAGIRAMAVNLLTYSEQRNLNTVQGIISRWAPPEDKNNTPEYVRKVAAALGVNPTDKINLRDPAVMQQMVTSIIQVENGKQPYAQDVIQSGINAAYTRTAAKPSAAPTAAAPGVQVDNTGRTVSRPQDMKPGDTLDQGLSLPEVSVTADRIRDEPAASTAPVADLALTAQRRALSMTPDQHNMEIQNILRGRQQAVQMYEQTKADAYSAYQDEFNRVNARRQQLSVQIEAARRAGNMKTVTGLLEQINTVDQSLNVMKYNYFNTVAQADQTIQTGLAGVDNNLSLAVAYQGLHDLQYRNDPTRLEQMWSRFVGYEVRVQPRTDGNFNLWVPMDGQLAPAGVYSKAQLSDVAMRQIIPAYRQQKQDAEAAVTGKVFEAQLDVWKNTQTELAKTIGALKVEEVKGNVQMILKQIENAGFDAPKELAGPNGPVLVAISKDGSAIMEIDVNPAAADKDGKFKKESIRVRPNPARMGLNTQNAPR